MKVYLGIDWSEQKHDVCFMNESGAVIEELTIEHRIEGFLKLDAAMGALGVAKEEIAIGLETAHNLLIDFLLERGYEWIYVLPPHQVKSNQGRYAQSGAKDDQRDAWVIADILRTDRGRLHAWQPDRLETRQIQVQVRQVLYLSHMIRRQTNHLRAILLRYFPAALAVFSRLDSQVALSFICAYPTPNQARQMGYEEFKEFLRKHHHTQTKKWPACYERLAAEAIQAHPDTIAIYRVQAQRLAQLLLPWVVDKHQAVRQLQACFELHPEAHLYRSLPGTGDLLAPALLAKLGDDRQRFPSARVLQAVAGTCPITKRSGAHKSVHFRQACDREFRYIVHQWAVKAITAEPWAKTYFDRLRHRGIPENDATRRLANRLLAILWKLFQTHTDYDPSVHLHQIALRAKPHQ